jgi:hypothetical protein
VIVGCFDNRVFDERLYDPAVERRLQERERLAALSQHNYNYDSNVYQAALNVALQSFL